MTPTLIKTDRVELLSDKTIVLPPLLCGPVDLYARIRNHRASAIDWGMRFEKRVKDTHRFAIADTRGRLELTVPIAKPENWHCTWGDIRLSDHGHWWDVHRIALESAYGRTPFFEFYIDSLLPMLTAGVTDRYPTLRSLSEEWDAWIRKILLLPSPVRIDGKDNAMPDRIDGKDNVDVLDCIDGKDNANVQDRIGGKNCIDGEARTYPPAPAYWQVRGDKLGFIAGLSVIDLIFNLGPEAVIYIDHRAESLKSE